MSHTKSDSHRILSLSSMKTDFAACRKAWRRQCKRLLLLCGGLLGCKQHTDLGPQWQLLQAAAARLTCAMTQQQTASPGMNSCNHSSLSVCVQVGLSHCSHSCAGPLILDNSLKSMKERESSTLHCMCEGVLAIPTSTEVEISGRNSIPGTRTLINGTICYTCVQGSQRCKKICSSS